MANLTRSLIAYDLNISPHVYEVEYQNSVVKYVFSSNLYKVSFVNKLEQNRAKINQSLSNRFGFTIRANKLADLKLYLTIEKRGFLIYQDRIKFECPEEVLLDGNNLTKQS